MPLRHARLLAGRRHPGPRPLAGDHRPAALPAARRPAAPGPARPGRRARLLAGRPAPGGHPAGPGRGAPHPHGRRPGRGGRARSRAWPPPRTAACCSATLPPMRRSVDRDEVEVVPAARRSEARRLVARHGVSSRGGRASRRGSASAARPSRAGRGRSLRGAPRARRCPTALSTSPPLPMTMAFCESRSTMISTRMCGHSHSVTRQVMAWGSSSRVLASSCSRTSSATQSASGVSVTTSSGKKGGPSGEPSRSR